MRAAQDAINKKDHKGPLDGKHVEVAVRQIAYYFSDEHLKSAGGKYMNDKMEKNDGKFEAKDLLGFGMIRNSGITPKHLRDALEWSAARGVIDVFGMAQDAADDLQGLFINAGPNSAKFSRASLAGECMTGHRSAYYVPGCTCINGGVWGTFTLNGRVS